MFYFVLTVVFILITDIGLNNTPPTITFAQSSGNVTSPLNMAQEWISQRDNVKIFFTYQPERPIIDTFTKLQFRVINLTDNEDLTDFDARVNYSLILQNSENGCNHNVTYWIGLGRWNYKIFISQTLLIT